MPTIKQREILVHIDGFDPVYHKNSNKPHVILEAFQGEEQMSALYKHHALIWVNKERLKAADLLGKPVAIQITETDTDDEKYTRYFTGSIQAFSPCDYQGNQIGEFFYYPYELILVPRLAALQQHIENKIWVNVTLVKVIEEICSNHGLETDTSRVTGNFAKNTQYPICVKFQQSDWDFLCFAIEKAGLFFWYEHDKNGSQKIIFSDKAFGDTVLKPSYAAINPLSSVPLPQGGLPVSMFHGFFGLKEEYRQTPAASFLTGYNLIQPSQVVKVNNRKTAVIGSAISKHNAWGDNSFEAVGNTDLAKEVAELRFAQRYGTNRQLTFSSTQFEAKVGDRFRIDEPKVLPDDMKVLPDDIKNQRFLIVWQRMNLFNLKVGLPNRQLASTEDCLYQLKAVPADQNDIPPYAVYPHLSASPVIRTQHWAVVVNAPEKNNSSANATASATPPEQADDRAQPDTYNRVYVGLSWDQKQYTPGVPAMIGTNGPAVTASFPIGAQVLLSFADPLSVPLIVGGPVFNNEYSPCSKNTATQTVFMRQKSTGNEETDLNRVIFEDKKNAQCFSLNAPGVLELFAGSPPNNNQKQPSPPPSAGTITLGNEKASLMIGADGAVRIKNSAMTLSISPEGELKISRSTDSDLLILDKDNKLFVTVEEASVKTTGKLNLDAGTMTIGSNNTQELTLQAIKITEDATAQVVRKAPSITDKGIVQVEN